MSRRVRFPEEGRGEEAVESPTFVPAPPRRAPSVIKRSHRRLVDPRQPWVGPHHTFRWRYMHTIKKPQPLPHDHHHEDDDSDEGPPPMRPSFSVTSQTLMQMRANRSTRQKASPSPPPPAPGRGNSCLRGALAMFLDCCLPGLPVTTGTITEKKAPRRWYRLHPENDILFFVRPDAGLRGQIPGVVNSAFPGQLEEPDTRLLRSQKWRRSWSVPDFVERSIGVPPPPGFQCDAFRDCCRVCFDNAVEVVALPCRHGGLCESCMRHTLFSRPRHRGGRCCPFCRRGIGEVIRICREAVLPQYGYTIAVG
mmetsp:Transcript_25612/g.56479  ORF Transcript_25612/g.56479 Transcript_25612/m.56479 type:complete len:308 (+) Transcript_25612:45-968(+)